MVNYNPQNHGYDAGKIGYTKLNNSSINLLGTVISLDTLISQAEEVAENMEEETPAEAWFMSGINKKRIKSGR